MKHIHMSKVLCTDTWGRTATHYLQDGSLVLPFLRNRLTHTLLRCPSDFCFHTLRIGLAKTTKSCLHESSIQHRSHNRGRLPTVRPPWLSPYNYQYRTFYNCFCVSNAAATRALTTSSNCTGAATHTSRPTSRTQRSPRHPTYRCSGVTSCCCSVHIHRRRSRRAVECGAHTGSASATAGATTTTIDMRGRD